MLSPVGVLAEFGESVNCDFQWNLLLNEEN